jgi:hypothetical protein
MRHVLKTVDKRFERTTTASHIASPSNQAPTAPPPADQTTSFLSSFNPAIAGLRMLFIEREHFKPRVVKKKRKVSVDLRRCYQQLLTSAFDLFALPALVEEVYNSIGGKEIPLIIDTGAC